MAIVTFDPDKFRALHPELVDKISTELLTSYFDLATMIIGNTDDSLVPYDPEKGLKHREVLLYLLVCHFAKIKQMEDEGQAGVLVSTSEGDVSASFSKVTSTAGGYDDDFFNQTKCGETYLILKRRYSVGGVYVKSKRMHPFV
jgi:hypothetical protein